MAGDTIAFWWVHEVTVEPYIGSGAYGDQYGAPRQIVGFLDGKQKLTRASSGEEIVTAVQLYYPVSAGPIPLRSRVTLPADYESVETWVASVERHDHPVAGMPVHFELALGAGSGPGN